MARDLQCDMIAGCPAAVSHIDNKGYVYCASHGVERRQSGVPCRKLRAHELTRLRRGTPIRY